MAKNRIVAGKLAFVGTIAFAAAVLAMGVLPAGLTSAQGARGTAEGRVTDAAGNVLKGVSVKLTYVEFKVIGKSGGMDADQRPVPMAVRTAGVQASDDEGKVTFANLEPRSYTATAYTAANGGAEVSVKVEAGKTAKFDMRLTKNR